uniref:CSON005192 protein n=1 Tax=Culicoides sonorensis TaxID=179676 RepID=A0A336MQT5_CULSO
MPTYFWKWCRLCGTQENTNELNAETKEDSKLNEIIKRYFNLTPVQHLAVCDNCNEFLSKLDGFGQQVQIVDEMFKELYASDFGFKSDDVTLTEIRKKYGLDSVKYLSDTKNEENVLIKNENSTDEIELENNSNNRKRRSQRNHSKPSNHIQSPSEVFVAPENNHNVNYIIVHHDKFNTSEEKSLDIEEEIERIIDQTPDSDDEINSFELVETTDDNNIEEKPKIEKISSKFECEVCNKSYSRRQTLEEHLRLKHGSEKDLKFQCDKCQRKFISEKKLKQHSISHLPANEKMVHPCKYCDKKFTKSVNVIAHIKAVHIGLRPFICESCGKSFQSKGALKDHQITHSDEKPWACSQCPKRFKNQARLKTHEDIHNTTSYICPHCGLALNTKRTLKMHLVVHSTEKKYKCNYCGSEYKRAKALKNHLILHTGLKPYACPFCNKTFANGSNCRSHKKKAHPVELAALEASGVKSSVAIPRLEMLQPKIQSNFNQQSDSINMQEISEHTIALPQIMTQAHDQCSIPFSSAGPGSIQMVEMQSQQQQTQIMTQIPTTYHVPVTMLSIIEQPHESIDVKIDSV